ncbi:MAG TPA: hypothetical protein VLF40_01415 [Candidatus Saccharimonadales bacterium]|nr:hypothetical protein [Candidatus Saccharimonadales bacterium]
MGFVSLRASFKNSVNEYAVGKLWYWYVPLWLFGLYVFVRLLGFNMLSGTATFVIIVPYSFDFMLHELAHIVTAFLPGVLTAAAGSGSELLLGCGLVFGAFWFRNYFALLFCCLWCDLTFQSAGTYMADAIPQRLPLVSLGGALSGQDPVHDWHYVFGQLHLLGASAFIGNSLRVFGHLVGIFGLVFTVWILYKMAAAAETPAKPATPAPAAHRKPLPNSATWPEPHSPYPAVTKGPLAERHEPPDGSDTGPDSANPKTPG